MDLADGGGIVGDDAGELEALAFAVEVDFFFEFAFEAGVNDVLGGAAGFEVVDVPADADRDFAVKAFFGLAIGALHDEGAIAMAADDVGDDLFEAGIFFAGGAGLKGFVGEDVIEGGLEVACGKFAGEEFVDAGGWDNEDVFVHARDARKRLRNSQELLKRRAVSSKKLGKDPH